MRRTPTPQEVIRIRALAGTAPAQDVGMLFDLGAETIRRIWRRETHRNVEQPDMSDAGADESLSRLGNLLNSEGKEGEERDDPAGEG